MQLIKAHDQSGQTIIGYVAGAEVHQLDVGFNRYRTLADLLHAPNLAESVAELVRQSPCAWPLADLKLLPPIDRQEVWAAGVTYRRSKIARMEESVGAAQFYDKVYAADRPELFFKATPHRVVGHDAPVRIRRDARWNVPEPELALVVNPRGAIVGYTIGNDMSSRDIEGENPLYLPQAKVYDACCALGPGIVLADAEHTFDDAAIELVIQRQGAVVFSGQANTNQLARGYADLVGWLTRECSFPEGAILLTGAGIVPGDDFTLAAGDQIEITIAGIGALRNTVTRADDC
jgi:2-dehydro-3-deoxy-D-arabinonate dehydratase